MQSTSNSSSQFKRNWRTLRLFNAVRIVVAATLYSLTLFTTENQALSPTKESLYQTISLLFLLFSMLSSLGIHKQWPRFSIQIYLYAIIDIIAIIALTHALGSSEGSLEILLIITIVGTALLLPERGAMVIAALATLALLGERSLTQLIEQMTVNYTQAGLLGATFLATALLTTTLNRRLKESERLAEQRGVDLENLAQLNEHVIQLLKSGVLVIDSNQHIHLMNQAALHLLGQARGDYTLGQLSIELQQDYLHWLKTGQQPDSSFTPDQGLQEISARFSYLGRKPEHGIVIFLEDSSALAQQVQHLKLVSLGQLTASIAHEIRNPLGAISHAAQLLEESPALEASDHRLIEIIDNHSSRVNTIIESILQLSRRERFKPSTIALEKWLESFIGELADSNHIERSEIAMTIHSRSTNILMDPTHLYQVVNNLCNNAIRHSRHSPHTPKVELYCGNHAADGPLYLEVRDRGPGIDETAIQHIFEPFYTTENSGTGLGLYIARELCQCNHAKLDYISRDGGACFRITFNNPDTTQPIL